ncbi:MAG: MobA/MobL family protein, partial [Desulforhopalus sp.]
KYGVAADISIHAPDMHKAKDERQHHAHILLTACTVSPDGTLGKKAVELDPIHCQRRDMPTLTDYARQAWQDQANRALAAAGSAVRIDHRSYADQGIDKIPTKHLGPAAAGMEARGEKTERGDINREIAARNAEMMIDQARLTTVSSKIRLREYEIRDEQRPTPTKGFFSALKPKPEPEKPQVKKEVEVKTGAQRITELVELLKSSRGAEWVERLAIEKQLAEQHHAEEKALAEKVAILRERLEDHQKSQPPTSRNGLFGTNLYLPHHVKKEERQLKEWEDRTAQLRQVVSNADDKLYSLRFKHKKSDLGIRAESQWRQDHPDEIERRRTLEKELKKLCKEEGYTDIEQERVLAGGDKNTKTPHELHLEQEQQKGTKTVTMDWSVGVTDPNVAKAMKGAADSTNEPDDNDSPEPESYPSPGM